MNRCAMLVIEIASFERGMTDVDRSSIMLMMGQALAVSEDASTERVKVRDIDVIVFGEALTHRGCVRDR